MFKCLYRCGSDSPSTQEYHIYPLSASAINLRLETGVVCDRCNSYFAVKLEQYFIEHHPGASMRMFHVKRTRKGKAFKFRHSSGEVTRKDEDGQSTVRIPLQGLEHRTDENGDIIFRGTYRPKPFDPTRISRVLAKIAMEYLCSFGEGSEVDPSQERFDEFRNYTRRGTSQRKYVWFAWKRTEEPQRLPLLINIQNEQEAPVAQLCRISLPRVAYLIPLPPFAPPPSLEAVS